MAQTPRVTETDQQPLGESLDFRGARPPGRHELVGRSVTLVPVNSETDAEPLYRLSHPPDGDPRIWTYLPDGPFPDLETYRVVLESARTAQDAVFFTVRAEGRPAGVVSYLAIVPEHGTIELGNIWFGPGLARTSSATEAIYLLIRHAFDDLGYRRVEWKCNALNGPSRRAAERFGFQYEGTFVQHRVVKGRNRDTAWFAMSDARWPELRHSFEAWLDPNNFDEHGHQRRSLAQMRD